MTEERIRQIFSEQLCGLKPKLYDWEIKSIQAVAAEAREEGIEEMRGAAARRWPKVTFAMTRIAERLKEKP